MCVKCLQIPLTPMEEANNKVGDLMKNIRVAIIGIGNMGSAHANCILQKKVQYIELTAVCDTDEKKIAGFKEKCPSILGFTDYTEMLKADICDAVIIATPHRFHSLIAKQAFLENKHVLVEKPIDISVTAAKELNDIAKKSGKVFGIMFNQRTNKLFQSAREIVKSGQLGNLKNVVWIVTNWYRTQHYYDSGDWRATWGGEGGGVLLNQAPHQLDLWQWICGMPVEVTAFCDTAKYHNIEVEDAATIFVKYPNGANGIFITSTGEYPGSNRLEISGEKGKLILEERKLKWWKLKENERTFCFNNFDSYPKIDMEYQEITVNEESGHQGILQNFANAILFGEELLASGYEGINALMLSNAAYLSQWNGNVKVKLPFDNEMFDNLLQAKIKSSKHTQKISNNTEWGEYKSRWKVNW